MANARFLLALRELASEFRAATYAGAALGAASLASGCGGESKSSANHAQGGAYGGGSASGGATTAQGGSSGGAGGTTAQGGALPTSGGTSALQPYSTSRIRCSDMSGSSGQTGACCIDAQCYEPPVGADCVAADDVKLDTLLQQFPPGSGTCTCYLDDEPMVSGPYAPNPAGKPLTTGNCCYLVGAMECEGRPLVVEGSWRVAARVRRSDWGIFHRQSALHS
ncbi:MAG: hypothetical protein ACOY0T_40630 [Myxococcota bacterium]